MPMALSKELRNLLARVTMAARELAEQAARAALENLAVHEKDYRPHMTVDQRQLRNRLRARGRALGDPRDERSGSQRITRLTEDVAYEQWHRLLFTRFLAENHLLHTDEPNGSVPVTLKECEELAPALGARDGFDLACRFASQRLPGVFRPHDPVLDLRLSPNDEVELRRLLESLPSEVFQSDDALGWTYQFWQAKRKDEINKSGVKIGANELPAVTQLFTEDYMVECLLHNTLGAWWAGKMSPITAASEEEARSKASLGARGGIAASWAYLRLIQGGKSKTWSPAAGTFPTWPQEAKFIKFLDPCMGSGHFVVFALPLIARMRMEEEGLSAAQAIHATLGDNLFNLELDERCTQIAAFNLALTAWKLGGYQPLPPLHLACSGLAPNAAEKTWVTLAGDDDRLKRGMARLYALFKEAPVLGSLINPRASGGNLIEADFHELQPLLAQALKSEKTRDDDRRELSVVAEGLAKAGELMAGTFTLVATNVPYLGSRKQSTALKTFSAEFFPASKEDLATTFLARIYGWIPDGTLAAVTPQNWLYQIKYTQHRYDLLTARTLHLIARLGEGGFESPQAAGAFVALTIATNRKPSSTGQFAALDVSALPAPAGKAKGLVELAPVSHSQADQLRNPDYRLSFDERALHPLLDRFVDTAQGVKTGDDSRWSRQFWEVRSVSRGWVFYQSSVTEVEPFGGRNLILDWSTAGEGMVRPRTDSIVVGRFGVLSGTMRQLPVTLYTGERHDSSVAPLIPRDPRHLVALWSFCSSPEYHDEIRKIEKNISVTTDTLAKIPFDLPHWQKVAAQRYPRGLPKPYSDDPTQWLFGGNPKDSRRPLQVAVARLVGYRWPRQAASSFPDCPALGPDGLEPHVDEDGVVCIPPLNREQPAAGRLRTLLAASFGSEWDAAMERSLLLDAGSAKTTLEEWLRDEYFGQHCDLFQQRPFVWHIWDGRKDGFHALVNYHFLDQAGLKKLTYSYLGDWIRQQADDAKADRPGAAERLGVAQDLQAELVKILEGEPPYDIFVRWKRLAEQPLGWNPDLNDGVRLNIRPFLMAQDVSKKGAGVLRVKPNIKWDKDRGKEPHRKKADFPWFWCEEEPETDPVGGKAFVGHRWNGTHLTLAKKRAAHGAG